MKNPSSNVIEHLACMEVVRYVLQPPYHLLDEISTNDKSPSYDGQILIYENRKQNKENLIGSVPVQVKGTTKDYRSKSHNQIKYRVTKEDLEVYYKQGGVLFFIVYIDLKTSKKKLFYKEFLPVNIGISLRQMEFAASKKKKNTKSQGHSFLFKQLEIRGMEELCKRHMGNREKHSLQLLEIARNKKFEEYIATLPTWNGRDEINIFEEEFVLNGVEDDITYPITSVKLESLNNGYYKEFTGSDGETKSIFVMRTETEQQHQLTFENTAILTMEKQKNKKVHSFKWMINGMKSLVAMQQCLEFLNYLHNLTNEEDEFYKLSGVLTEKSKKKIEELTEANIRHRNNFGKLGIPLDLELSKLADSDLGNFLSLIEKIEDNKKENLSKILSINKSVQVDDLRDKPFIIDVAKCYAIAVYIHKEGNLYTIKNFNDEYEFNNTSSKYVKYIDEIELYIETVNSEPTAVLNSIKKYTAKNVEYAKHNSLALRFVMYHIENKTERSKEYAEVALQIFEIIQKAASNHALEDIKKLATFNIIITQRILGSQICVEEENRQDEFLRGISEVKDSKFYCFAASVLLSKKAGASKKWEEFSDAEKKEFESYPIMYLYSKLGK